jgi:hypothetical protein
MPLKRYREIDEEEEEGKRMVISMNDDLLSC